MLDGGGIGLVEDLDGHRIAQVDQRRKADQGLLTLADFHQFGQFAKAPAGVAVRDLCHYLFRS